jgi:hypothetical protein
VFYYGIGGGDKYIATHPRHCSRLIWYLYLVRYFMSSPVNLKNLNTKTNPSLSVSAIQVYIGVTIGALYCVGVLFIGFTALAGAFVSGCPFRSVFSSCIQSVFGIIRTSSKGITSRCGWLSKWPQWLPSKWLQIKH